MKRFLTLAGVLALALALWVGTAFADSGPKPQLTVTVADPPEGEYYLDLLIPEGERGGYDNLGEGSYDSLALQGLHTWEGEGWYPALAGGTGAPLHGKLTPGGDGKHRFSYFGLPQTFRIAVSANDGGDGVWLSVSHEPFTRTAFYTNLTYDTATGTITRSTSLPLVYAVQFLSTLLPTLLIEGAVLLLFGFRWKENWKVFLLVNLITQVGLHLAVASRFALMSSRFGHYLMTALPAEAVILGVEAVAYARLLRGHTRRRRVGYAAAANTASFLLGFLPIHFVIEWIAGM